MLHVGVSEVPLPFVPATPELAAQELENGIARLRKELMEVKQERESIGRSVGGD